MTTNKDIQVLVTNTLPGNKIEEIKNTFKTEILDHTPSRETFLKSLNDKDALICTLNEKIDQEIFSKFKNLKIVSNVAVGYNNIDVNLSIDHDVKIAHTPDVLTNATAEFTMGLILSLLRRIPEGDQVCRSSQFTGWTPTYMLGTELSGKKLGIIGNGRIGSRVSEIAKAFKMQVLTTPSSTAEEIFSSADIISVHVPLKKDTFHMINSETLKMMKKTAFLINTSRGEVVDEKALAEALSNGQIQGAALDVFEDEPQINDKLKEMKQVILTPHIGSATTHTRVKMADLACSAVLDYFSGKNPENLIPEWKNI
jgi:glyoxylate reductase